MRFSVRSVRTVLVARSEKKKERKKKRRATVGFHSGEPHQQGTGPVVSLPTGMTYIYIRSSPGAARYERQQAFIIDVNTAE